MIEKGTFISTSLYFDITFKGYHNFWHSTTFFIVIMTLDTNKESYGTAPTLKTNINAFSKQV